MDYVLVMSAGTIIERGTYIELMSTPNSYLSTHIGDWSNLSPHPSLNRRRSSVKVIETIESAPTELKSSTDGANGKLISEEELNRGKIGMAAYFTYARMLGGSCVVTSVALSLLFSQATRIGTDQVSNT